MSDAKLRECPLCGGPANIWRDLETGEPRPHIWCRDSVSCGCMLELHGVSAAEAIAAWNRRKDAP